MSTAEKDALALVRRFVAAGGTQPGRGSPSCPMVLIPLEMVREAVRILDRVAAEEAAPVYPASLAIYRPSLTALRPAGRLAYADVYNDAGLFREFLLQEFGHGLLPGSGLSPVEALRFNRLSQSLARLIGCSAREVRASVLEDARAAAEMEAAG